MADRGKSCDDKCGCVVPCPGGASCRCGGSMATSGEGHKGGGSHSTCSCGAHCGCNPCTCGEGASAGAGRTACTCGTGCHCSECKG